MQARRWLFDNMTLKAAATLISVLLYWFVNADSNSSIVQLPVAVQFLNLPEQMVVLSPLQPRVHVAVRGPKSLLGRFQDAQHAFRVDLANAPAGKTTVKLVPQQLGLDPFFSVLAIEPNELELTVDSLRQKEVPIQIDRVGEPRGDIRIEAVEVVPTKVQVSGPSSEIAEIKSVLTQRLDLSELKQSTSKILKLVSPGPLSLLTPSAVVANVRLSPQAISSTFQKVPIELRAAPGTHYWIEPPFVDVTVKGPPQAISHLTASEIMPYVRIQGGAEIAGYRISLDVPSGIEIVKVSPDTVVAQTMEPTDSVSGERPPRKK